MANYGNYGHREEKRTDATWLQGIGWFNAIPAERLVPGMLTVWNSGGTATVVSAAPLSAKFVSVVLRTEDGKEWPPRRFKRDRLVAVPKSSIEELRP